MRPAPFPLTTLAASALALAATAATAGEVTLDGHRFAVPDGFTVERVAGPPLVDRPVVADFDERGRLYVADSSGSNEPVRAQLEAKPHRIVRLEDADGDGTFDRSTVFADRLMFPEGAMWSDGSLYVSAPPQIWKLTDTDDDGVADRREVWFDGKTLTGCANDLHGPYLGPDGYIYWCKGAFAEQTYERPGRSPLVTRAAHIFRRKSDGSGPIEPVMTGGMDNPVDVVFTRGGERIFTTTFLQHPAGGNRDGLIHAIYGGVYGKVHDVIDGHPRTSPEVMPVLAHLGPAAPCGLVRYESSSFGDAYRDNLFATLFNMHKVTRHALTPDGSTFACATEDFLTSDNVDFHPTDVIEDADGSLLVVDTGGWYKLCCPTSALHKPDVLGAIYRVRRVDAPKVDDPRGGALDWSGASPKELAGRLGDPRPAVRRRAREALARTAGAGMDDLRLQALFALTFGPNGEPGSPVARENAVWAAGQIDHPVTRGLVRIAAIADPDDDVRQAALNLLSLQRIRDPEPLRLLVTGAQPRTSPRNRRLAAEVLGRDGDPGSVPALLDAAGRPDNDRPLEHAITFALIEIGDPAAIAPGLESENPGTRRAALVALDQLGSDRLDPKAVAALLTSKEARLREAASWVLGRHPEWGGSLAGVLADRLRDESLGDDDRRELASQLARFAGSDEIAALLAATARDDAAPEARRRLALGAMAASGREDVPDAWLDAVAVALGSEDDDTVREGVAAARSLRRDGQDGRSTLATRLLALAGDEANPDALRLDALAAVPGGLSRVEPAAFDFLLARLDPDRPVSERLAAADVLASATLGRVQRLSLADRLADVGPLEVDRLLPAFEKTDDEAVGLRVVEALGGSPSRSALRPETLRPRLARYGKPVQERAERLYREIAASHADESARLERLLVELPEGDVRRGHAVFHGTKAACASCHAIGYVGGKVGPDLTRIGSIREPRDLLESIVFPSASFVRSYEPVTVATADGRVVSGLLRKDASDEVVLTVAADKDEHIPRAQVEAVQPGTVSVMPAGLDQQLTPQELADLVAFLKACR
jgi:putative membrane-bound dehydrogenase-like protein